MHKSAIFAVFLCVSLTGCAGVGTPVISQSFLTREPVLGSILADLAANDTAIRDFRGAGTFTLESPEFDARRRFRGSIRFRRPADLYVQGNHRLTNMTLFKLISVGDEFLMEFPTDKEQSFYQISGEEFEDVPFSVSPSDIVREMFLPEVWSDLRSRQVRVVDSDSSTGSVVLEIGPRRNPKRRLTVMQMGRPEPRWVWVRSERIADGKRIAITEAAKYSTLDGVLFPTQVDAFFPTEETRMTFVMRNIRLNTGLDDSYFDIRTRVRELDLGATATNGPTTTGK
jgi:hypothetical protein